MLTFFAEELLAGVAFTAGGAFVWFFKAKIQSWVIGVNAVSAKLHAEADAFVANVKKLKAEGTSEKIAADLAAGEIAAETTQAQLNEKLKESEIGHSFEPEKLAFYITLVFYAKCVIWDTMFGLGSTPALKGDISTWAGLIMSFYFAKRGFENCARILKR
jgi:hypothetical protein